MVPTKYRKSTECHDYDEEDKDEDLPDVLVPYDLDTSSLAIHVACLRFVANTGTLVVHTASRPRVLEMASTRSRGRILLR